MQRADHDWDYGADGGGSPCVGTAMELPKKITKTCQEMQSERLVQPIAGNSARAAGAAPLSGNGVGKREELGFSELSMGFERHADQRGSL